MPYKRKYKKRYNKRGWRTSVGRVMCAGKQKISTIKTNEKYYSEIDKFHQEAKDKYYSNNSNPAESDEEYDEDVLLAKAISLSLNIQNKPEESNIEEPKPVESNVEEPVIEESKEESQDESSDEFEFPRFFTISGSIISIDNPINSEKETRRNYLNTEITKKEHIVFLKKQRFTPYAVITENELASHNKLVKEIEDLKMEKMKVDKIPRHIWKLRGSSSPSEVFPYIVIDDVEDLETNISYFIEENPEYFVTYIGNNDRMNKFMFQKKY